MPSESYDHCLHFARLTDASLKPLISSSFAMSYQAGQPQMQGQQHGVAHSASVGRKPMGPAAPGTYQQATNFQAAASPALSHSSTVSAWSPQSIGSSQSSPAQTAAIPNNMAQPAAQYAPTSYSLACSLCGNGTIDCMLYELDFKLITSV